MEEVKETKTTNESKKTMSEKKIAAIVSLVTTSYGFLVTIIYLVLGLLIKWWHPGWILFISIPLVGSIVLTILKRKASLFSIEIVATIIFL